MTVSEWLIKWLRECPDLEDLLYNTQQEANGITIIESAGEIASKYFVNGSFISTHPFTLFMKVHQQEANELQMQNTFGQVVQWMKDQEDKGQEQYSVNENVSIMRVIQSTSLAPTERDKDGNITYQATFNIQYITGGN